MNPLDNQNFDALDSQLKSVLLDFYDKSDSTDSSEKQNIEPYLLDELNIERNLEEEKEFHATGGSKDIFRIRDGRTARTVALARLKSDADQKEVECFLNEARITAALEHPNIVPIHDIGLDDDNQPYFLMKFLKDQSLEKIIREISKGNEDYLKKYPQNVLLEIFIKICEAVAYSHSRGIVHLDLKPANIMIGDYGEVYVCDWGLAKFINNRDEVETDTKLDADLMNNITLSGVIKGTLGYMAPEQIDKTIGKKGKQTDVYALGGILYSILTGHPPVEGEPEQVLKQTCRGKILTPRKSNQQCAVESGLSAVAMKALSLHPKGRYGSVNSLRNDVHSFMTGYSTLAENAGFMKEFQLFFRRNKAVCLVIILAFILVTALTLFFIDGLAESKREAELNQVEAIKEKNRAEKILSLYENQKKSLSSFVSEKFPELKNEVYEFTDVRLFADPKLWSEKAIVYLQQMINSDPDDLWPYMQLGYVYFITQNFEMANKHFSIYNKRAEIYYRLSRKYAKLPRSKEGVYDTGTLINIFEQLSKGGWRRAQIIMMMRYDGQVRESVNEHTKLIHWLLKLYNPQWSNGSFSYAEASKSLTLSGKGLFTISAKSKSFDTEKKVTAKNISLIKSLELNSLSLRGSDVFSLEQLQGLKIQRLDIRDTLIQNCRGIDKILPDLKELTVNKGQIKSPKVMTLSGLKVITK